MLGTFRKSGGLLDKSSRCVTINDTENILQIKIEVSGCVK